MLWKNFLETPNCYSLKDALVMTNQRIKLDGIDIVPSTIGLLKGIAIQRGYYATIILYPDLMIDNLYRLANQDEATIQMNKYPKKLSLKIAETYFSKFQIAVFS